MKRENASREKKQEEGKHGEQEAPGGRSKEDGEVTCICNFSQKSTETNETTAGSKFPLAAGALWLCEQWTKNNLRIKFGKWGVH